MGHGVYHFRYHCSAGTGTPADAERPFHLPRTGHGAAATNIQSPFTISEKHTSSSPPCSGNRLHRKRNRYAHRNGLNYTRRFPYHRQRRKHQLFI